MLDEPEAKEDLQEHKEASVIPEECETAEPDSFNLILSSWICHMLIKLKLNYNCSNSLFSLIIAIVVVKGGGILHLKYKEDPLQGCLHCFYGY